MGLQRKNVLKSMRKIAELERQDLQHELRKGVTEKTYFFRQEPYLVEVVFSLSFHDWCTLKNLKFWGQVEDFLAQKQNSNNQNSHIEDAK